MKELRRYVWPFRHSSQMLDDVQAGRQNSYNCYKVDNENALNGIHSRGQVCDGYSLSRGRQSACKLHSSFIGWLTGNYNTLSNSDINSDLVWSFKSFRQYWNLVTVLETPQKYGRLNGTVYSVLRRLMSRRSRPIRTWRSQMNGIEVWSQKPSISTTWQLGWTQV